MRDICKSASLSLESAVLDTKTHAAISYGLVDQLPSSDDQEFKQNRSGFCRLLHGQRADEIGNDESNNQHFRLWMNAARCLIHCEATYSSNNSAAVSLMVHYFIGNNNITTKYINNLIEATTHQFSVVIIIEFTLNLPDAPNNLFVSMLT